MTDKIGITELNYILINGIPNIWSKQAYVQGFDCESISLKMTLNMFEHIEIDESIYECVVTPSYKTLLGKKPNEMYSVEIIEKKPPCQTLTPRRMGALISAVNYM